MPKNSEPKTLPPWMKNAKFKKTKAPGKLKGFDYEGSKKGGVWKNPNGVQVGRSVQEDSQFIPTKSTGDTAAPRNPLSNAVHIHLYGDRQPLNTQKAAKLKNQLKSKGG
jgi:hypothetical protein